MSKWEYKVFSILPPPPGTASSVMDGRQIEDSLNHLDRQGWELVTYGPSHPDARGVEQGWWVFRRARK
jgi:hypothetical protein